MKDGFLGTEKEINILYRRMCGFSANAIELQDANESCHAHARNLVKASKLGVKKPWNQKQINGWIYI